MAEQERKQRGDQEQAASTGADDQRTRPARRRRPDTDPDIEAMNTDGRGTGGMGDDAGGYGPVPGSDATG